MISTKKNRSTDEDALLVLSCLKGDPAAFEPLVLKYQKRMFNIALRITGDYEDAGEVTQEAFLSAYRNIEGFRGDAGLATWLTSITVNLAKNRLKQTRGRRRHESYSLDDPIPGNAGCMAVDPPSDSPSVLEEMEKKDIRRKVQECIKALDDDFREVLILRDMQDFSYGEIGTILKLAIGTVKSRISRARESVRDCLKMKLGDEL